MDKKKTAWENFREKAKVPFANMKKGMKAPGKLGKKPKPLAYRRSLSVPDLRFVQSEAPPSPVLSTASALSTSSAPVFFGGSGRSDSGSITSGSITSGSITSGSSPVFTHRLTATDLGPSTKPTATDSALVDDGRDSRASAPVAFHTLYEEEEESDESANAPAERPATTAVDRTAAAPVAAPRKTTPAAERVNSPAPEPRWSPAVERKAEEEGSSSSVGGADRVAESPPTPPDSRGDRVTFLLDKLASSDRQRLPSEMATPPAARANSNVPADRWSLQAERQGESAEATYLDSPYATPLEEHPNMPWPTDSEDLDMSEPLSPLMRDIFIMEAQEDMEECNEQSDPPSDQAGDAVGGSDQTWSPDAPQAMALEAVPPPIAFQRFLLTINLKEGRNLVIRDRNGTSDPYIKFKLEGKTFYKSKVVYKNLNPRWNESFSFPLRHREHSVEVRVYDKDFPTDDFMGASNIVLKDLELDKTHEMDLALEDANSKEDDMGFIRVEVRLTFRDATIKRNPRWMPKRKRSFKGGQQQNQAGAAKAQPLARKKSQVWSTVYGITLVEGQDMPSHCTGDVYVCFRLGELKYKSKNLCIQSRPQWREEFEFNKYDDVMEPLQVEVFVKRGRKCEECWGLFEIDLTRLPVNQKHLYTHMLDPGKGRLMMLVTTTPCWGVSISPLQSPPLEKPAERDAIMEKFSLRNTHRCMREVGYLQVKVIKATDVQAADLNGKSDPFCVVELGNSRLQTQAMHKTLNPDWKQVFTFPVKDMTEVLELTVFDENSDKANLFLGKVAIPLLTIKNGQQVSRLLKKEDLVEPTKGTITLEMAVIYNPIRAGIKTFQPKETKFSEDNARFSKKVLAQNIYRLRKISTAVLYTLQYIKRCTEWQSTRQSIIAFLMFVLTVWHWEIFMLPLFLLLLIGWNYFQIRTGRVSYNQDLVNTTMAVEEEEDEKDSEKKGLMDKIHMVQEIVLTVQNILDELASAGERIKNTFNWSLPFLSCLVCLALLGATAALYYIPLRYIVLIWGVNKFTKKLRQPYAIDNNAILDFLKRVPSDVQKVQYSELRAPGVQGPPRRRK